MAQAQAYTGTIAAFFADSDDARRAVHALKEAGFSSAHLGIARQGSYAGSAGSSYAGSPVGTSSSAGNTAVRESEDEGHSTWEKIKEWFAGDDVDDRKITRDSADYDTDTSDLHGSFTAINVPENRARYFFHRLRESSNGAVVTVQAGGRSDEAESILSRYKGDFGQNAESYDYTRNASRNQSPEKIQLLGEVLRVHKDRVNRGEVRIRKEVVTEDQSVQVPVQREELVIERNAANANTPARESLGEKEIRVPLSEERASVGKSTVVREEVSVGKKPVEQVRDLKADVRHEELVVEDETQKRERSA